MKFRRMTKHKKLFIQLIAALGLVLGGVADHRVCADMSETKEPEGRPPASQKSFSYPYHTGRLSFPQDEGKSRERD